MESETCFELALEGERLCKSGDFQGGVAFFEAAIKLGTNDTRNLSAIYSQLGNAHFYLSNYEKALHYHNLDLSIAKTLGDNIGEAKAYGNIGNTMKMMGDFEKAAFHCRKHLDISVQLNDKISEGRALYNLGNVYHTQAKHLAKVGHQEPGEFSEDVKQCLLKAIEFYERNLELMIKLGDKAAQGRAYGNLGNTHYLLGNFNRSVHYHEKRLQIAKEFGDKAAERRAECNLGNAHIFLCEFDEALKNYQRTLVLAQELNDVAIEAQACYSLGNTYTLIRDYNSAIQYHLRHLQLAQQLRDEIGEGRAFWSLGNALSAIGKHEEALSYASKHLQLSKTVGDKVGELTAQRSISNIRSMIEKESENAFGAVGGDEVINTPASGKRNKRFSMENMEVLKLTPGGMHDTLDEASASNVNLHLLLDNPPSTQNARSRLEEENFLDLLERFQGKRMDDQRCSFDPLENKENQRPDRNKAIRSRRNVTSSLHRSVSHPPNVEPVTVDSDTRRNSTSVVNELSITVDTCSNESSTSPPSDNCREELFDMINRLQSRRMDEQRAPLPTTNRNITANGPESLPGVEPNTRPNCNNNPRSLQRVATTTGGRSGELVPEVSSHNTRQMSLGTNVLPDDEFFEMLMRCQSSRLEDQRSVLPSVMSANGEPPGLRKLRRNSQTSLEARRDRIERSVSVESANQMLQPRGSTVPDDDFFSLILRFQSGRIEDQRSFLPVVNQNQDQVMTRGSTSSNSSRKSSNDGNVNDINCTGNRNSSVSKN